MNSQSNLSTLVTIILVLAVVFAAWYFSSAFIRGIQDNNAPQKSMSNAEDTTIEIYQDMSEIPQDPSLDSQETSMSQELEGF